MCDSKFFFGSKERLYIAHGGMLSVYMFVVADVGLFLLAIYRFIYCAYKDSMDGVSAIFIKIVSITTSIWLVETVSLFH